MADTPVRDKVRLALNVVGSLLLVATIVVFALPGDGLAWLGFVLFGVMFASLVVGHCITDPEDRADFEA